jgi:catechol-2,3-dioxygenase
MTVRQLETSRPGTVVLSHAVLRTAKLDEVVEWYGHVLGTRATFQNDFSAGITFDGEHHRLAFVAVPPAEVPPGAPGIEHIAFKQNGLGDLMSNYARLKELGIAPIISINHTATVSLYYVDPDGVQVELFIDAMTADRAIDHMTTPEFAANPIGSPFDPENLLQRYVAGESLSALLEPPPFDPSLIEALLGMSDGMGAAAEHLEQSL